VVGNGTLLTEFQIEVARIFSRLPSSEGFLLAGGAALAAQHLTAGFDSIRPSHGSAAANSERTGRRRAAMDSTPGDRKGAYVTR
jgi:hypothetical protein